MAMFFYSFINKYPSGKRLDMNLRENSRFYALLGVRIHIISVSIGSNDVSLPIFSTRRCQLLPKK